MFPKQLIPIVFALQELLGQFVWAKAQRAQKSIEKSDACGKDFVLRQSGK
jgi:hypothetical protein